jgi:hypothetical protein
LVRRNHVGGPGEALLGCKENDPPELLWEKPPLWQIALLLTLLGFIVYLYVGPY